ncbi:MAG: hemolysin family protein [Desulfarculaceae bacterium]|jgi:CBS domain containing-hemolysin-like protein
MATLILAVSISILVSAMCSLLESVLYSTRMISLEAAVHKGNRRAKRMRVLKSQVERPLASILILNTLANTAGAALAGWAAAQVWGAGSLWAFSLAFTMAILLFSEIIPKTVGAVHWRRLWSLSVWPLEGMLLLLAPVIWLTQALTRMITRGRKMTPKISEDEILAAARMGASGGEISEMEHHLITNIIHLEEQRASDIMTPRTVLFTTDGAQSVSQARKAAQDWPHTRVPVVLAEPEDVRGYVIRNEVMIAPESDTPLVESDLLKPVRFVPASANALNLLHSFLRRREHFYLVVDEYGGIMGLVGLEDVLESLVGSEIVDEHEQVADLQELARQRGQKVLDSD